VPAQDIHPAGDAYVAGHDLVSSAAHQQLADGRGTRRNGGSGGFLYPRAVAFLAERTGLADPAGAAGLAA
jgi:hypothetical protein